MGYYFMVLGCIISGLGIKLILKKPKYQSEKTTNGRIVKFLDSEEMRKIKRNKAVGKLLLALGVFILGTGIYILLAV